MLLFGGMAYAATANPVVQGTHNSSIYKTGQTVTINGAINGDVFCAGQTVNVHATVHGDILCAGQTVNVDGQVFGSVRLAGQTVNLTAQVTHGASLVGQDLTVQSGARIGQDVSLAGQTVTVNGSVGRDISAASSNLTLASAVGRNVTAQVEQLTLNGGAKIGGSLTYTSPNVAQLQSGAVVSGKTTHNVTAVHHANRHAFLFFRLYWLVALIVFGIVLAAIFGRLFRRINPAWGTDFWIALLTGFVASIVVPIGILILFATVIGVPLALLVLLLWLVAALLSLPVSGYFTGSLLLRRSHPVLIMLVGTVILALLTLIPFVGWFIALIIYWLGVGIILVGIRRHYPRKIPVRSEGA
ncbi:MAG TPA: hypothetical protein VFH39_01580 [Candidatus Saccharimonadales bacterium]|nr:hypothetical protein [Candidatus Saccharimonadales bacterium]